MAPCDTSGSASCVSCIKEEEEETKKKTNKKRVSLCACAHDTRWMRDTNLGEGVHDGHGGVADGEEAERQRDGPADDGLAVLEQVVEGAHGHRPAEVLAHGDHGDAQHGDGLVAVVLLEVLAAHGQ